MEHQVSRVYGCYHHHCHSSKQKPGSGSFVPSSLTGHRVGTKVISISSIEPAGTNAYCGSPCNIQLTRTWSNCVYSYDSSIHVKHLEDSLLHLLSLAHKMWLCWRRAGDHTGQPFFFPSGRRAWRSSESCQACRVLASDKQTSTHQIQMIPIPTLLQHAEPSSACVLRGDALTCTDTSPTRIVGGNFVGGLSSSPSRISFSLAVSAPPCLLPPLPFVLPAHLPILLRLILVRACHRWHTRFARFL